MLLADGAAIVKVLAWPAAAVLIALIVALTFHASLSHFIDRVKSVDCPVIGKILTDAGEARVRDAMEEIERSYPDGSLARWAVMEIYSGAHLLGYGQAVTDEEESNSGSSRTHKPSSRVRNFEEAKRRERTTRIETLLDRDRNVSSRPKPGSEPG